MQVPVDGRRQWDPTTIMVANAMMGRMPQAGVEKVTLDGRYILKNSWPTPRPSGPSYSSSTTSSAPVPEAPRSSARARSLWPHLP
jgi:hypothetical protein